MTEMHVCKLADIPTEDSISGQDACKPGRPARLSMDKIKLHYVVHYTFRATWDKLVPKEKEEELGKIEVYQCQLCSRRFRNNHTKKQYPGRGSMVCHLATEHGQLLKAMRADELMDMQSEIEALDRHEKGKFLEMGIPDVADSELYIAKESYMWKFEQGKLDDNNNQEQSKSSDPKEPKIVPRSKTELAEMANKPQESNNSRCRPMFEMRTCKLAEVPTEEKISGQDACRPGRPANLAMDKMKLHYVVHYTFRGTWDNLVPKENEEELGKIEVYQCNMCQRRFRNNHNKKQYPGRGSMVCHLATEHGQLLKAMRADNEVDMQSEIDALDRHENGKFLELGIPEVADSELYTAKESYMWKFQNEKLEDDNSKKDEPKKSEPKEPKIVPRSKTELAEMAKDKKENEKATSLPKPSKKSTESPEPTRGKRTKSAASKAKWVEWMSDDNEEEEADDPPKTKKAKSAAGAKKGKK